MLSYGAELASLQKKKKQQNNLRYTYQRKYSHINGSYDKSRQFN